LTAARDSTRFSFLLTVSKKKFAINVNYNPLQMGMFFELTEAAKTHFQEIYDRAKVFWLFVSTVLGDVGSISEFVEMHQTDVVRIDGFVP
jgi:hypothetical protein